MRFARSTPEIFMMKCMGMILNIQYDIGDCCLAKVISKFNSQASDLLR